jgi:deazaflavin-dependent oxidoreductase (nitroreductase family)
VCVRRHSGDRARGRLRCRSQCDRSQRQPDRRRQRLRTPADIHRVHNTGDEVAISIHIYGTDITRIGSSSVGATTDGVEAPERVPPPGTLKAKLVNLIPKANVILYRWSGGRIGGRMGELPVLIPHTVGRKSGKARQSPMLYIQDGEDYVVVGSRGGSDAPPAWWLNLQALPEATIEVKGTKRPVCPQGDGRGESQVLATTHPRVPVLRRLPGTHSPRTPVIVLSSERNP